MFISVRDTPLNKPLFSSNAATWAEIRDEEGFLTLLIIFPPGKRSVMIVDRQHQDFGETIKNFGIKMQEVPITL